MIISVMALNAQVFSGAEANAIISNASIVKLDEATSTPEYFKFQPGKEISNQELTKFLREQFRLPEDVSWVLLSSINDKNGDIHNRYRFQYMGYIVHEGMFITHERNGMIYSINGNFPKNIIPSNSISMSEATALNIAIANIGADVYKWQVKVEEDFIKRLEDNPNATWYPKGEIKLKYDKASKKFHYAWVFDIYAHQPMSRADYYIDAQDGNILFVNNKIKHGDSIGSAVTKFSGTKTITADYYNNSFRLRESGRGNGIETYNMQTGTSYGSAVDFTDSDNYWNNVNAQKDEVATDAQWGMEMTYDYYFHKYGRNSINGNGFKLKSYVHYNVNYANAFWNGQYMTFGDGNSSLQPLVALDIVGHEISHGLTTFTADLDYQDESGAMNEGYSDIFGTAIEHYGKPSVGNWTIGENIGNPMRSMSNPKSKGDPDTYLGQNYYLGTADNGGVHTNSGVLNHWFYLTSQGGQGVNDNSDSYNVTGLGIDTAGAIAFRTLTVYLINTSDYADCRFYSILSATDLYGNCSSPVITTTKAFYAVGIGADYIPGVHADFNATITSYCAPPATTVFQNLSNNATAFYWDFGDGDTSSVVNPSHVYSSYGGYTVKLIAMGGSCGTDTVIKSEYISVDTANPCFNFMPPSGNLNVTTCRGVVFDNGGLSDYTANTNTSITIAPVGAATIKLTFTVFDFESGYDYLKIYDGPNTQSPLIGSYDGNALPNGGVINSTGSSITLLQTTDQAVNAEGFVANYECILPTTPPISDFEVSDSLTCSGVVSFTDKSKNGPVSWEWNFGDGKTSNLQNPTHTYMINGLYTVTLKATNAIGNNIITKTNVVNVDRLLVPYAPSIGLCNGGNADLITQPTGSSDIVYWFNSASATTPIHTGDTLSLTNVTSTQSYFTEIERPLPYLSGGKANNGGGGGNLTSTHGLYFDVYQPLVIHSVNVYANSSGNRSITLKRSNGITIGAKTFSVVSGMNTVVLDFTVPVGTDFLMTSTNLYRNNNSTNYPYVLPNYLSINRSTAGTDPTGYYYYFYDWKIKQPSCFSDRVEVKAYVNNAAPIADFSFTNNGPIFSFTDISQNQGATTWDFGDGTSSVAINPTHFYAQSGTYQVTLNVDNGCGTDTKVYSINVVNSINNSNVIDAVKLYPNPTDERLFIEFNNQGYSGSVSVFDYTGNLVGSYIIDSKQNKISINTMNFASGLYMIQLQIGEKSITRKFVVQ